MQDDIEPRRDRCSWIMHSVIKDQTCVFIWSIVLPRKDI